MFCDVVSGVLEDVEFGDRFDLTLLKQLIVCVITLFVFRTQMDYAGALDGEAVGVLHLRCQETTFVKSRNRKAVLVCT